MTLQSTSIDPQRLGQRLDALLPAALDALRQMVAVNSFTLNAAGVNQVGDLTAALFEPLGFTSERPQAIACSAAPRPPLGRHLILTRPGTSGRRIGLVGHLDTVYTAEEEQANDFTWRVAGDLARPVVGQLRMRIWKGYSKTSPREAIRAPLTWAQIWTTKSTIHSGIAHRKPIPRVRMTLSHSAQVAIVIETLKLNVEDPDQQRAQERQPGAAEEEGDRGRQVGQEHHRALVPLDRDLPRAGGGGAGPALGVGAGAGAPAVGVLPLLGAGHVRLPATGPALPLLGLGGAVAGKRGRRGCGAHVSLLGRTGRNHDPPAPVRGR